MATYTTNIGLAKPAPTDPADIAVLNSNFDKIDTKCNPALFAPSGYGLGGKTFEPETKDLNDVTACGWYAFTSDMLNRPFNYGSVMVSNRYGSQVTQMAFNPRMGGYGEICVRHFYDGSWNEWEYINPPMMPGVEYRTTERIGGKAVFAMLIDCGTLPNTSSKNVTTTIPGTAKIVSTSGILVNSDGASGMMPDIGANGTVNCTFFVTTGRNIQINTFTDMSAYTAHIMVKYTKG